MNIELKKIFSFFLGRILKPVAEMCLRRGVKFQEVNEILKYAFINAAEGELLKIGQTGNASKLSVMTGLQRKDILKLATKVDEPNSKEMLLTKVIGCWQNDPRFCGKSGKPKALNFEGAKSEFADLVSSVVTDLNPYTVLFEFERLGIVKKVDGKINLKLDAYVPSVGSEESLSLLANDVQDLLLGVEENIFSPTDIPNLHLKTRYDNVCRKDLPKIKMWFLEEGAKFHARARNFLAKYDKDINPLLFKEEGGATIAIGSFSRIEQKNNLINRGEKNEKKK